MAGQAKAAIGKRARLYQNPAADTALATANIVGDVTELGELTQDRNIASYSLHTNDWEQKLAATKMGGELSVTLVPSGGTDLSSLQSAFDDGEPEFFAISIDDTTTTGDIYRFSGIVKTLAHSHEQDEPYSVQVTIAITDAIAHEAYA